MAVVSASEHEVAFLSPGEPHSSGTCQRHPARWANGWIAVFHCWSGQVGRSSSPPLWYKPGVCSGHVPVLPKGHLVFAIDLSGVRGRCLITLPRAGLREIVSVQVPCPDRIRTPCPQPDDQGFLVCSRADSFQCSTVSAGKTPLPPSHLSV